MADSKSSSQTLRIVIDDDTAQGEYVNFANIMHSPSEFVMDFGRIVPGRNDVKILERIIMTPLHTKQLLQALAQNIHMFEEKFGEIQAGEPAAMTFSRPEPGDPN